MEVSEQEIMHIKALGARFKMSAEQEDAWLGVPDTTRQWVMRAIAELCQGKPIAVMGTDVHGLDDMPIWFLAQLRTGPASGSTYGAVS